MRHATIRGSTAPRRLSGARLLAHNPVERAHDIADGVGRNARVVRRHVKLGMTEQRLDDAHIDVAFQLREFKAGRNRQQELRV